MRKRLSENYIDLELPAIIWWHRDLLDERVVQALRIDPEFWRTSRKDDRAIKEEFQQEAIA